MYIKTEIAFFGGSFTGLDKTHMINLLELAGEYIEKYRFIKGVRVSTRPDYITWDIIGTLLKYRVTDIELGIQSLFDDVLLACNRGCTAADCENACKLISLSGIDLTAQIMIGLPESSRAKDIETARQLADSLCFNIKNARIYPAVVLPNTELYNMYKRGEYAPVSLNEAVNRAKEIKKIFDKRNVNILRMGLCSSDEINLNSCIGPYHPAFGELVEGELIYDELYRELLKNDFNNSDEIIIETSEKNMSRVVGHGKKNIARLQKKFSKNIKIIRNDNNDDINFRLYPYGN